MSVYAGPNTTSSDLVLHIDPSNPRCYPGSGSTLFDLSGGGNNGTLTNGASVVSQGNNRVLNFDGVNDFLQGPNYSTFGNFLNVTLSAWVLVRGTNIMCPIGKYQFPNGFAIFINNNRVAFDGRELSTAYLSSGSSAVNSVMLNTWYHVCGTKNGNIWSIYLNGILESFAIQGSGNINVNNININLTLGSHNHQDTNALLNGLVDDGRFYTRALSHQEIINNFNATRGRYGI